MFSGMPFCVPQKYIFSGPPPVTIPDATLLYRRSISDFQDTARVTAASSPGDIVRSATNSAASANHLTRASPLAAPTVATGGGLMFGAASGKTVENTFTLAQPFVCFSRIVYSVAGDYFPICDKSSPDNWFFRINSGNVNIKGLAGSVSAPMWAPDSTARIMGAYFNGASSKIYVAGTLTSVTSHANGILNGLRLGCYNPGITTYSFPDAITDVGIWSGTFTDDQLFLMADLLTSVP